MGKKLESNFKNMVIVLFGVTLFASVAVGYVNTLTAGPIEAAKQAKQTDAIRQVIPEAFDNDPNADRITINMADGGVLECYPAKQNGKAVGMAVKTYTNNGFGGQIWVMVGFHPDGRVANYSVLEHKETPGLGSKMDTWFTKTGKGNIIDKIPGTKGLRVRKDGGDVDAITAATISSRAFLDAINRAASGLAGNTDTSSGATQQANE